MIQWFKCIASLACTGLQIAYVIHRETFAIVTLSEIKERLETFVIKASRDFASINNEKKTHSWVLEQAGGWQQKYTSKCEKQNVEIFRSHHVRRIWISRKEHNSTGTLPENKKRKTENIDRWDWSFKRQKWTTDLNRERRFIVEVGTW